MGQYEIAGIVYNDDEPHSINEKLLIDILKKMKGGNTSETEEPESGDPSGGDSGSGDDSGGSVPYTPPADDPDPSDPTVTEEPIDNPNSGDSGNGSGSSSGSDPNEPPPYTPPADDPDDPTVIVDPIP